MRLRYWIFPAHSRCFQHDIEYHPDIDVLVVSGGAHTGELNKPRIIQWVNKVSDRAFVLASVYTGAFILAEAGVLSGLKVTTHWEDIKALGEKTAKQMEFEWHKTV